MKQHEHRHKLRVQYNETDQMGVVHHSNYIHWFEIGRTEMIRQFGISYREIEELGLLLPVIDVHVHYRKPARYDEEILVCTTISKLTPVIMEFSYEIRRDEEKEELLVSGRTRHMWINKRWKPTRLNRQAPEIYKRLKRYVQV